VGTLFLRHNVGHLGENTFIAIEYLQIQQPTNDTQHTKTSKRTGTSAKLKEKRMRKQQT